MCRILLVDKGKHELTNSLRQLFLWLSILCRFMQGVGDSMVATTSKLFPFKSYRSLLNRGY